MSFHYLQQGNCNNLFGYKLKSAQGLLCHVTSQQRAHDKDRGNMSVNIICIECCIVVKI